MSRQNREHELFLSIFYILNFFLVFFKLSFVDLTVNKSSALKRNNNVMLYSFTNISKNNFTTEWYMVMIL